MGVDFLVCNSCGETFPDCGSFVRCNCGNVWCSEDCAESDGHKNEKFDTCNTCEYLEECEDNEDYECEEANSCDYCNVVKVHDSDLLDHVIKKHYNDNREELVKEFKGE